jgi:hypothetical protein
MEFFNLLYIWGIMLMLLILIMFFNLITRRIKVICIRVNFITCNNLWILMGIMINLLITSRSNCCCSEIFILLKLFIIINVSVVNISFWIIFIEIVLTFSFSLILPVFFIILFLLLVLYKRAFKFLYPTIFSFRNKEFISQLL